MKTLTFTLAAATLAFIMGCQSPDGNNPVAVGDGSLHQTIAKAASHPDPKQIGFDQKVTFTDPGVSRDAVRAIGNVVFTITKDPVIPPFGDNLYDVQIDVKGVINQDSPLSVPWTFGGSSRDRIAILSGQKVVLTKGFTVQGAAVPTDLEIQFSIGQDALGIGTMSLTELVVGVSDGE